MPVLTFPGAVTFARLLTHGGVTETIHRALTNIAIARATTRWLAIATSEQQENSRHRPLKDGPAESNAAIQ